MSGNVPTPDEKDLWRIVRGVRDLFAGRSNAVGSITLTASVTTTVVTAINCGEGCTPILTPMTAHASAEFGNGTIYVSAVKNGSFTVTHASNSQTDRTYRWAAFG